MEMRIFSLDEAFFEEIAVAIAEKSNEPVVPPGKSMMKKDHLAG